MAASKHCGIARTVALAAMACLAMLSWPGPVYAGEPGFDLSGFAEGALLYTPEQRSAADGGLGKLRWGGTGSSSRGEAELTGLLLHPTVTLPGHVSIFGDVRYDSQQKTVVDLLDAAVSWAPPLPGPWSTSVKAGAFFPPFGLENQDIGWTSPYTITSSALGSWVGEELRTIGGEVAAGWRGEVDTLRLVGAVYGWNDPAGVILADRGWSLNNRPLGLFDHLRIPDATAKLFGSKSAAYTPEFREIDGGPGWYAGAAWEHGGLGRVQVYRYDNRADPSTLQDGVYGWRTKFWDVGYTKNFHPFSIIAEGVTGSTAVDPGGRGVHPTNFYAAYV